MAPAEGPPPQAQDRSAAPDPFDTGPVSEPQPQGPTWGSLVSDSSTFSLGVQHAIGRAVTDPAFRKALFRDPEATLSEFDMTERERRALLSLDPNDFDSVVDGLRAELDGIMQQLVDKQRRVVELAEAWEKSLLEIDLGDDDLGDDPSESGAPSQ
jgi:hypothetical protein